MQAEVCGCHPGDQRRDAEPEEVDDEEGWAAPAWRVSVSDSGIAGSS
jgi:hypothetical protein